MANVILDDLDNTYSALGPDETIFGKGGDDTLSAHPSGSTIFGGDGDDTLNGGPGNDILQGDDDNNLDGKNKVFGNGGDDVIIVLSGRETVDAGSGNDEVRAGALDAGQLVKGGTGTDTLVITGLRTFANAVVDFNSTSFTAEAKGIARTTYAGFEILNYVGANFRSEIYGGDLDDTFEINSLYDPTFLSGILDGRDGDDLFVVHGLSEGKKPQFVLGGNGDDSLQWDSLDEIGALRIDASAGRMIADGRQFLASTSIEHLRVQADQVLGTFAYSGLAGTDNVFATAGKAIIRTFAGDDNISIDSADAKIDAGNGDDSVSVTSGPAGAAQISGGGGNDDLSLFGKGQVSGDGGDDALRGTGNLASLFGGSGDDSLTRQAISSDGPTTSAVIDGGTGTDTLTLNLNIIGTTITANFARNSTALPDGTTVTNCEIVHYNGGFGTDIVKSSNFRGGAADNFVYGAFGNDVLTAASHGATLDGGYGDDKLKGGRGADILLGGFGGNDTILGKGGRDTIDGGTGIDVMTGGKRGDTFVFKFLDARATDADWDRITDFSQGQHDRIDLRAIDADTATIGVDEAFVFTGQDGLTGAAAELAYHHIDKAGTANDLTLVLLSIADGVAPFAIALKGLIDLTTDDFMF